MRGDAVYGNRVIECLGTRTAQMRQLREDKSSHAQSAWTLIC